jgi:tetratricopeptide (TPR) repeat protein
MSKLSSFPVLIMALSLAACHAGDKRDGDVGTPGTLADIEKRILADPMNAALFAERARYFEGLDSARSAMNDWNRAIALDSTNIDYHIALADLFYRKVRIPESERVLRKAITMSDQDTEARLKLSELKLIQREYIEAMELANTALRIDPQNAKGYFLKGWIHMEAGDTTLAISSYRTAVERDPAFHDAYLQLGILHAALRDPLAAQYYASALEVRPNSVEAWYGMGMFAQENGQDSLALACYARIKEIAPRDPLGWYNTGYVLLELRNSPMEARPEFEQALRLSPAWPEAYYNRGLTYELDGRLDSALVDYRRALALSPDMTIAAQGLERLRSKGVRVIL